jgi:hypothetical protein
MGQLDTQYVRMAHIMNVLTRVCSARATTKGWGAAKRKARTLRDEYRFELLPWGVRNPGHWQGPGFSEVRFRKLRARRVESPFFRSSHVSCLDARSTTFSLHLQGDPPKCSGKCGSRIFYFGRRKMESKINSNRCHCPETWYDLDVGRARSTSSSHSPSSS